MLGSAVCTLGVLLSAWVPDIYYLYFTYGILGGLGRAFTYSPGLVIVGKKCFSSAFDWFMFNVHVDIQ